MSKNHLYDNISNSKTEEELKISFIKFFRIIPNTQKRIDLYTEQIIFEFKLDDDFKILKIRAKVVAQALYYVRRLKFGDDDRSPTEYLCIVSKNSAALFKTDDFADFYSNNSYDWDLKPSSPCKILVNDLAKSEILIHAHIYDFSIVQEDISFATTIMNIRKRRTSDSKAKTFITQNNFYQIFQYWQSFFGAAVENGHKPSEYFLLDIEQGKSSIVDNSSVIFRLNGGEIKEKLINPDEYKYFWSKYAKITSANEIIAIRQKMDRITEINLRRFTGEFYTPVDFAKKAFDYLTRTVGEWWKSDNFRLWDMAAGTGNLEFAIPPEAIKFCYISTLIDDEAKYCKQIFPQATVFQYDYLNDPDNKLPQNLREDLANPEIRWIIFLNPPYATASNFERNLNRKSKDNISMTAIREQMNAENLGEVSRELFSQFIYRISKDFSARQAWLGIFSKIKYINSNNDQKFRDKVFRYKFERGFIFNSKSFDGCKAQFPVGFLVWNLGNKIPLEEQKISLDIYDSAVEKVGVKIFRPARREKFLSKWIERPSCIKKFPPMSSALTVAYKNKDRHDKISEGFLAGFMFPGNDFVHQNYTAFLSGSYVGFGALSVTAENFEQAMIVHMVRRLPKATWLNDRDQFLQPSKELSREFICDAVIWSLFSASNQTASLRNVEYEGETYQIINNFYPFELSEIKNWECTLPEIRWRIATAYEDRFAAMWIKNNRADLSIEAIAVLEAGKAIYKRFYAEMDRLDVVRWKISDWDAGWYQIRMSLDATLNLEALSAKLLPKIYDLGFLRDEVRYF